MIVAGLRRAVRLPLVLVLLFAGLATVLAIFPLMRAAGRRATIRLWSRALCRACGLRVTECPAPGAHPLSMLPPGHLIVANHVSWLDIFAIDALCPASFVAKDEIARWPLIGTLVARAGTLFIERGRRHAVHRMIAHVEQHLRDGGRVAVFPEGTTGDGTVLMPFHANLVQAAVVAGAPVLPLGLRYRNHAGGRATSVEFIGDTTFFASIWRILGAPLIHCEVHPLPPIPAGAETRHAVAARARQAIAERLALPLDDTLPDSLRTLRGLDARHPRTTIRPDGAGAPGRQQMIDAASSPADDRSEHPDRWSVAVVIPAFNEGSKIGEVVARVREDFARVLVVDDGSADDTAVAARLAGAEVLVHPINLGQGAALQTGMRRAIDTGAQWVVTFDADGQHDPGDALRMLARARADGLDICFGSRFLGETQGMPLSRRLLLRAALAFQRLTTGMRLTDVHNGLRVLSRDAAARIDLRQNRMAHASEFVAQVAALRMRVGEEPVTIRYTAYSLAKGQRSIGAVHILIDLFLARLGR